MKAPNRKIHAYIPTDLLSACITFLNNHGREYKLSVSYKNIQSKLRSFSSETNGKFPLGISRRQRP